MSEHKRRERARAAQPAEPPKEGAAPLAMTPEQKQLTAYIDAVGCALERLLTISEMRAASAAVKRLLANDEGLKLLAHAVLRLACARVQAQLDVLPVVLGTFPLSSAGAALASGLVSPKRGPGPFSLGN